MREVWQGTGCVLPFRVDDRRICAHWSKSSESLHIRFRDVPSFGLDRLRDKVVLVHCSGPWQSFGLVALLSNSSGHLLYRNTVDLGSTPHAQGLAGHWWLLDRRGIKVLLRQNTTSIPIAGLENFQNPRRGLKSCGFMIEMNCWNGYIPSTSHKAATTVQWVIPFVPRGPRTPRSFWWQVLQCCPSAWLAGLVTFDLSLSRLTQSRFMKHRTHQVLPAILTSLPCQTQRDRPEASLGHSMVLFGKPRKSECRIVFPLPNKYPFSDVWSKIWQAVNVPFP